MVFREWIKTEIEAPPMTGDRCKSLEEVAWATLLKVRDGIIRGGKWRSSVEVVAAEAEIRETYQAVVAGTGSLKAFSEACDKWKRAGIQEGEPYGSA